MTSDPVAGLCDTSVRILVEDIDRVKLQGGYTIREGTLLDSIRTLCTQLIEASRLGE